MERGSKKKAEQTALTLRTTLGVHYTQPLLASKLATHFRVPLLTPHDVPGINRDQLRQLLSPSNSGWSAVCIPVQDWHLIIYNPMHSQARRESDVTHELAHIICHHKPSQYVTLANSTLMLRSSYDEPQEDEANWLSGCLKLPRTSLVWAVRRGMTNEQIGDHFVVSEQMVRFRRNMTGVNKQLRQ